MVVEFSGQQIRVRVRSPKVCASQSFRTQTLGKRMKKGQKQRVACVNKQTGKFTTQSWRINLSKFKSAKQVRKSIDTLPVPTKDKRRAKQILRTKRAMSKIKMVV